MTNHSAVINRYGHLFPEHYTDLEIECVCFREGFIIESGALGKAGHFKAITAILWPEDSYQPFLWHPWAEDMLRVACDPDPEKSNYICVSGPGDCGKSRFFGVWALVNWLCDPLHTLVLITSTTLKGAKKRIWAAIKTYFNAAKKFLPGKLVDSMGMIRTYDREHGIDGSDDCGLHIIAGEKGKEAETLGKLIGMHNKRVFLIGDELPELSHTLVKAVMGNISTNPWFQFVGIGNPNSIYDPHGMLATPMNGWGSVDDTCKEWKTKLGWHIRFDAEESPNILAGRIIWDFLPTQERLDKCISDNPDGKESLQYWRMWKAFWCPEGTSKGLYTEPDILNSGSLEKQVQWRDTPTPVAFLDLGYTNGGDSSIATAGLLGICAEGYPVLLRTAAKKISEDVKDTRRRMTQIAAKFIEFCKLHHVAPQHAGYDSTGGGVTFGSLLAQMWDGAVYDCDFSGMASELTVSVNGRKAEEMYVNRATEIWACGSKFLECGQLRGITGDLAREMMSRRVTLVKGADGDRQKIEDKKSLRNRTQGSPDIADSYFGMLALCRDRLKFVAQSVATHNRWAKAQWKKFRGRNETSENGALPVNLSAAISQEEQAMPRPNRRIRTAAWNRQGREEGWGSVSMFS